MIAVGVQDALDAKGITLNKNCVPGETRSPKEASGIQLGTAAMTTKGWEEKELIGVAGAIDQTIKELREERSGK